MAAVPYNNQIIQELSDLINRSIDIADFPYKKGNSIRIGGYAIRKKKSAYIIIDCSSNKIVQQLFSQTAAIALAKKLAKDDMQNHQEIVRLDQQLQKNYIDCIFYSHTIENTKDELKKATTLDRYDIAKYRVEDATLALESHIFR
ncbi:MAG: hypothetical protein CMN00_01495 [Rickettsiales bacterium]|nr:hypothetical protein [Rickettsiales bacterium]|tara:strand:+ start:485 stop:919 length:435 start_codon:yes stop_codon:yes gene_type:complete